MEMGRINFQYRSINRVEILIKMAIQIFFYIHSNCVFSRPFEKTSVAQWRRVELNFRYHFINQGEILKKRQCLNIFLQKLKLRIFQDNSIMGPNEPVSEPIAWLYRLISEPKKLAAILASTLSKQSRSPIII